MSIILSILLVSICIISYVYKKYNVLLFLLILSLFGDIFEFQIGVAFKLHHFVVLLTLPRLIIYYSRSVKMRKYTRYLVLEFLLILMLGIIFGFIIPFDDPFANSRLVTQSPAMRAIISSVRMFLDLSIVILIVYWINTNKISLDIIAKFVSIILIINVSVAIVDYFNGYMIKTAIYPDTRIITDRFTGLSGEPKAFGRYCSFGFMFLLFFLSTKNRKLQLSAILISMIGVILSLSASTLLITIAGLSIYLFSHRRFKSSIVFAFFAILAYSYLNTNIIFQTNTLSKIQTALGVLDEDSSNEKVSSDEPTIFSRFDVFDRAALNFFYNNPKYIVLGVGPNLISTPASYYLTPTAASIFSEGINTAPGTYLINTLSRSGFVGVIINILFFIYVLKSIRNKSEKYFYMTFFIMSLMVGTSLFYFFNGISIGLIINRRNEDFRNYKIRVKQ